MRTTVNLDDDVLAAAKAKRRMSGENLGKILSSWAKAGMKARSIPPTVPNETDTLPSFNVDPDAQIIPSDRASDLLDNEA